MMHNIDSINAAIRLGDKVLPPSGCKIKWYDWRHKKLFVGIVNFTDCDLLVYCHHVFCNNIRIDYPLFSPSFNLIYDKDLEILEIPEDSPPFEEWDRYNET